MNRTKPENEEQELIGFFTSMFWHEFIRTSIDNEELEVLLADGWRHFGTWFYRHILSLNGDELSKVLPVRINLARFRQSKSQRKLWRRNNKRVRVVFRDAFIDREKELMFSRHKQRFKSNVPETIYTFFSSCPSKIPAHTMECCLFDGDKLFGVSFFDITLHCTSAIYAMFLPEYSGWRPGIYTMLAEVDFSISNNKKYHYMGYAFRESSFYDYKKQFYGVEVYDWNGHWRAYERETGAATD